MVATGFFLSDVKKMSLAIRYDDKAYTRNRSLIETKKTLTGKDYVTCTLAGSL